MSETIETVAEALREAAVAGDYEGFVTLTEGLVASRPQPPGLPLRREPWVYIPSRVADLIDERCEGLSLEYGDRLGPRSLTFKYYVEVAAVYEAASRMGYSPTKQVALWGDISLAAAQKQILRAREFNFLPSPQSGKRRAWLDVELDANTPPQELIEHVSWTDVMKHALNLCQVAEFSSLEAASFLKARLDEAPSFMTPAEVVEWEKRIARVLHDRPVRT